MSITDQYSAVAGQARSAAENSVEVFRQGAERFNEQVSTLTHVPQIDLGPAVDQYFGFVQRTVDVNREFVAKWVDIVSSLSGVVREQAQNVGSIVREQGGRVADVASQQVKEAETVVREHAEAAEQAEKAEARRVRLTAREQQKQAHENAREPYQGLTKAELSELLAKRDLPKTGNVDELIERLVEADTK